MRDHFNNLRPDEAERLAMLAEEAGEIVQAVGKILRHGYESYHPEGLESNRDALAREIGDLSAVVDHMRYCRDLSTEDIHKFATEKHRKMPRYTHHQAYEARR